MCVRTRGQDGDCGQTVSLWCGSKCSHLLWESRPDPRLMGHGLGAVSRRWLPAPTVASRSLMSKDLRIAADAQCMFMPCGKHEEAAEIKTPGYLSITTLNVSVYIWSGGNHQECCARCPLTPKCSNCFVTLSRNRSKRIFLSDRGHVRR